MNQQTIGLSPKAIGGAAGGGIGWALSQIVLAVIPGKEDDILATAITILVTAAVGFVGAYLPKPGVVVAQGHGENGDL